MNGQRKQYPKGWGTTSKKIRKNSCELCNKEKSLENHHIIPVSRNGTNNEKNIITLCKRCHFTVEYGFLLLLTTEEKKLDMYKFPEKKKHKKTLREADKRYAYLKKYGQIIANRNFAVKFLIRPHRQWQLPIPPDIWMDYAYEDTTKEEFEKLSKPNYRYAFQVFVYVEKKQKNRKNLNQRAMKEMQKMWNRDTSWMKRKPRW